jgi:class 3 adenylate cyclase/serine/threonine protein kinase
MSHARAEEEPFLRFTAALHLGGQFIAQTEFSLAQYPLRQYPECCYNLSGGHGLDMSDQSPNLRPQSRLTVLMFTDIVGSVDLRRRLGDAAAAKIISKHDEMFRRTVGAFAFAEILKDLGDGFLARFSSASDAVHAALHFQSCLHSENWNGEKLRARVGLHLGEVAETEIEATTGRPKLSGMAVDIAARVMGLSVPGQILMTRAAFDNARQYVREQQSATDDSPAVTRKWMAHGRYMFKGAEEPLEIFEVGEVGIAPLRVPPDSDKARRAVAADQEETLGWRPAVGMPIPERKNWVLERRLGEGGFGEVWLGEHSQSKAKRVFKFCFDAERLRSFKRELMLFRLLRDALGDRNDIAKLHEVQMDVAPFYLESEFTEDGSLVEWAASKGGIDKVPLETRLDIVARTAIAVAAAHSVGILHKDIKPSNILIYREHDGIVRPRLTDFGIGELTDPTELAKRNIMVTGMSDSFMTGSGGTTTRVYAPPEVLVGKPFTIQGDVYGLGVLLYQMVIGDLERPIAEGWERDIPDPLLREDIARCVEGHPNARLGSAKELADRLQHLPARRRVRRRRQIARVSMFASVVFAALLLASGAWVYRERGQRLQLAAEYQEKKAVLDFFLNMISSTDPRENPGPDQGRNVKVVDQLTKGVRQLDAGELSERPNNQAAVRGAIGNAYRSLSHFDEAERQLAQAVEIRRSFGESSGELAQLLEDYGAIKWTQNHLEESHKLFTESLQMRKAIYGEESLEVASSLNYLAANLDKQEKHKDAESLYRQALGLRERLATGPRRIDLIARSTNNLGTCLRSQERFTDAIQLFEKAINDITSKYGPAHLDVGNGKNSIGLCLLELKRYDEAERTFNEAMKIKRNELGDDHLLLAVTYWGLGKVCWNLGRFPEAEQHHRAALELRRKFLRVGHPDTLKSMRDLAEALLHQEKYADAQPLLVERYETLKSQKPDDAATVEAANQLADCYDHTGRSDLASSLRNSDESTNRANSP